MGESSFDTFYPAAGGVTMSYLGGGVFPRYYGWASLIEGGRVVATDYAPDSGWLDSVP